MDAKRQQPEPLGSDTQPERSADAILLAPEDFETVLHRIASRLSNASDERFDDVMTQCLRKLVGFFAVDRRTVMAFSDPRGHLRVTHFWAREKIPCPPEGALIDVDLPWYTQQIRSGNVVSISSGTELPAQAGQEKAYLLESGMKSSIAIPLMTEDAIFGSINFGAFDREVRWSLATVSRLRLVGEVVALAQRRHQYARGLHTLMRTMDAMRLHQPGAAPARNDHLHRLAVNMMRSGQQERRRMSEMVHEDIMQILCSAALSMNANNSGNSESQSAAPARTREMLGQALDKLRQLAVELWPEPTMMRCKFVDGMRRLCNQVQQAHQVQVSVAVDESVEPLDDDVRPFLYDSTRKLLQNVVKDPRCRRAWVDVRRVDSRRVRLTVSDDGAGLGPPAIDDPVRASSALFSLAEQAELLGGRLDVSNSPGNGTRAVLTVPG